MQAYRVKGQIDESGRLIVTEAIELAPGEVDVIVLQSANMSSEPAQSQDISSQPSHRSPIRAFQELFENAPPIPPDFDPDQAKWEYLKEKHNL